MSAVCGLDYPFALSAGTDVGAARLVSTPSGGGNAAGLARDHQEKGFPEFEQFCTAGFPAGTRSTIQVRCVYQFRHARSASGRCIASDTQAAKLESDEAALRR